MFTFYLLRWDLECLGPHVNLLININTGDDKEHSWPPRSPRQQSSKAEDDSSLIFLKVSSNQRPVFRSRDQYYLIRSQYSGHVTSIIQPEASI